MVGNFSIDPISNWDWLLRLPRESSLKLFKYFVTLCLNKPTNNFAQQNNDALANALTTTRLTPWLQHAYASHHNRHYSEMKYKQTEKTIWHPMKESFVSKNNKDNSFRQFIHHDDPEFILSS